MKSPTGNWVWQTKVGKALTLWPTFLFWAIFLTVHIFAPLMNSANSALSAAVFGGLGCFICWIVGPLYLSAATLWLIFTCIDVLLVVLEGCFTGICQLINVFTPGSRIPFSYLTAQDWFYPVLGIGTFYLIKAYASTL